MLKYTRRCLQLIGKTYFVDIRGESLLASAIIIVAVFLEERVAGANNAGMVQLRAEKIARTVGVRLFAIPQQWGAYLNNCCVNCELSAIHTIAEPCF